MNGRAEQLIDAYAASPTAKLDLSNCNLTKFPSSFAALSISSAAPSLTLLNLANNNLTYLPPYLSKFPNLRILFCPNNVFTKLPPVLSSLQSVTMLSFKNNALEYVAGEMLPPNIEWLILTSNRIEQLATDFPYACRKVRKLMLSNNLLYSLPSALHHMQHVELLRLANNKFETFPHAVLKDLPRLIWLAFGGNPCTGGRLEQSDIPNHLGHLESIYDIEWNNPFGSGASGTTYPATHKESGERFAVKKFTSENGSDGRAIDEIAVSVRARGVEGVVSAIGHGYAGDSVCMIMEIVEGKGLANGPSFETCTRSVYGDRKLSKEEAERICRVVRMGAKGLAKVGVAHGDIYAHNVIVGDGVALLGDLGAAWVVPEDAKEGVAELEERAVRVLEEEVWGKVKE